MKKIIDIISIMPEYFDSFLAAGLIRRSIKDGIIEINIINPRTFSKDKYKRVDEKIYGGGAGQLLMAEPILKAWKYANLTCNKKYSSGNITAINTQTIIMSASGKLLSNSSAKDFAAFDHLIIICGRYEGIDARVTGLTNAVEISIGDYILSGGEIAGIVLIESVARYIDGFLGNTESLKEESFCEGISEGCRLLEYPQYTKPREIYGMKVPAVLLSGNHKLINKWRIKNAIRKTKMNRPGLLKS